MKGLQTDSPPLVSVVIPNYNYARYLKQRFDSILEQTFQDFEIIFLDDASTDDSVAIVRDFIGDRPVRFEVSAANSGNPFVQWNRGVRLSRGEFVWIAEADDFCESQFLESLLQIMRRHPEVGLCYCNTVPVDSEGSVIDAGFYQRYVSDLDENRWHDGFVANGRMEVAHYLSRKNTITNVSGVLFRREAFIHAGYAQEGLKMCGDWLTYCHVLNHSDIAYVNQPLNFHRQHPSKHTQNSVLNLTYFREFLSVQQYVDKAFQMSGRERLMAFRRFLGEWDRLTVSHYGRIDISRTWRLAVMAHQAYPGFVRLVEIGLHFIWNGGKSLAGKYFYEHLFN